MLDFRFEKFAKRQIILSVENINEYQFTNVTSVSCVASGSINKSYYEPKQFSSITFYLLNDYKHSYHFHIIIIYKLIIISYYKLFILDPF